MWDKKKNCKNCPIKEKCIQGKDKTRTVARGKDEPIFEWTSEHLQTQRAKAALKRRKIWPVKLLLPSLFIRSSKIRGCLATVRLLKYSRQAPFPVVYILCPDQAYFFV
ncbi:transposase [Candidatus Aquicultor secundus]|uniref:transposase n=1 Tax=Candidatus Aquicultor secundus TaxID=1973895 RepID=UPI00338D53D7|nr:hypothetical protein [Solirubrobacter sp.]